MKQSPGHPSQHIPLWLRAAHFGYTVKQRTICIILGGFMLFFGGITLVGLIIWAQPDHEPGAAALPIVFGFFAALTLYLIVANIALVQRGLYRLPTERIFGSSPFERAFRYNAADLAQCREGKISDNMRWRLQNIAMSMRIGSIALPILLLVFTGAMGAGLLRQLWMLMSPQRFMPESFALWQAIVFTVATATGIILTLWLQHASRKRLAAIRQDLAEGRVDSVFGIVTRHRTGAGKTRTYAIQVGDFKSVVMPHQWRCFNSGQTYTLYHAPASGIILAVETS